MTPLALALGVLEEFAERAACDHGYTLAATFERYRLAFNEHRRILREPGTESLRAAAARLGADHESLAKWLRDDGVAFVAARGKSIRLPSSTFDHAAERRARRARPVRRTS